MDVDVLGGKFNLTDVAARVGLGQLPHLKRFTATRRALARAYFEAFANGAALAAGVELPVPDFENCNWHMFQIVLPLHRLNLDRAGFMTALKTRGVGSGVHYPPIHLFSLYRERGFRAGMFPYAERIGAAILTLPMFSTLTGTQVASVVAAVNDICQAHLKP
jgi:dTDP-4-amino-4,6-dideoxygalactose transaminase